MNEEIKKPMDDGGSAGFKRFWRMVGNPQFDTTYIALRCHLLTEYYIDQIIASKLPRGDLLVKQLSYSMKLSLLEALNDIPSNDLQSLRGLNRVRNQGSHEMDYAITEADIDKIGLSYGREYIALKNKHHSDLRQLLIDTLMNPVSYLDWYVRRIITK